MYIPKKKNISKTGASDPVYYHYIPFVSYVYKKRLSNTLSLLKDDYEKLLEIGYGSGILLPELSFRSEVVFGLETHKNEEKVYQLLKKENIDNVTLKSGNILNIPFDDNFFDCIVSVSTLEHISELDKTFSEMKRILKQEGELVLSFPVRNIITDSFFILLGHFPREIHPSSHLDIIKIAKKYFEVKKVLKFPNISNINYSLYCSILLKPSA